jgi:hypothetical protein
MLQLVLEFVDVKPAWPDLIREHILEPAGEEVRVACIDDGCVSGQPSIAFRIGLPDGDTLVVQTSARLFRAVARLILARYPSLLETLN